jgi:peptidoglycan/LPS O-acetylase OafA/YrhL
LRDKHLYWIDGLKGLSALIVVLFHLCLALIGRDKFFIEYSESYLPVLRLFLNGNFAVSIFIIVSSVLLLKKLTSQNDKSNVLGTLIIKRYFRILYPVGFVILLMYILFYAGAFYAEQYGLQTHNSWLIGQFASISALPRYILLCPFGVTTPVLNVGWMLGYIFCGNILALILDMILGDKKILSTLILLVLVSVIIKYYMPIYYQNVVFAYMVVLYDRLNIGKKKRTNHFGNWSPVNPYFRVPFTN